MILELV